MCTRSLTAGRVIETSLERTESPLVKIWQAAAGSGRTRLAVRHDGSSDALIADA
jgi:hypothetical protein